MKTKYQLIVLILVIFISKSSFSQDIHFSQFYKMPQLLNPAMSVDYIGDWRLSNIYRTQWKAISESYTTLAMGFEKKINIFNQKIGIGAFVATDQSGSIDLVMTKMGFTLAYAKSIDKNKFSIGVQSAYVMNSLSKDKLTFPSQYDASAGIINPNLPSNEPNAFEPFSYIDMNIGLVWSRKAKKIEHRLGYALYHVNKSTASFISNNEKDNTIEFRHIIHGSLKQIIKKKYYIQPRFLYMNKNGANEMIIGSDAGYIIPKNLYKIKTVYIGAFLRSGIVRNIDAMIVSAGTVINNFDICASYDFNISKLCDATHFRGAFELSLIYKAGSSYLKKITIPCDRF